MSPIPVGHRARLVHRHQNLSLTPVGLEDHHRHRIANVDGRQEVGREARHVAGRHNPLLLGPDVHNELILIHADHRTVDQVAAGYLLRKIVPLRKQLRHIGNLLFGLRFSRRLR